MVEQPAMLLGHARRRAVERFAPFHVRFRGREMPVDARLARFLVLEQEVGDPTEGRNHEDAPIRAALGVLHEKRVHQFVGAADGSAADLFDGMSCGHGLSISRSAGSKKSFARRPSMPVTRGAKQQAVTIGSSAGSMRSLVRSASDFARLPFPSSQKSAGDHGPTPPFDGFRRQRLARRPQECRVPHRAPHLAW